MIIFTNEQLEDFKSRCIQADTYGREVALAEYYQGLLETEVGQVPAELTPTKTLITLVSAVLEARKSGKTLREKALEAAPPSVSPKKAASKAVKVTPVVEVVPVAPVVEDVMVVPEPIVEAVVVPETKVEEAPVETVVPETKVEEKE